MFMPLIKQYVKDSKDPAEALKPIIEQLEMRKK